MIELAPHLSAFLREYLPRACNASRHTVASYADSFMLLVGFAAGRLGVRPCEIAVEHLTPQPILDFLDHLEEERGNSVGTRNVRLAAIKSFFRELELSMLRQRSREAQWQKAGRGELFTTVAVGYVKVGTDRIEMDPDQRVRDAIALVFRKFAEFGSGSGERGASLASARAGNEARARNQAATPSRARTASPSRSWIGPGRRA